MVALTLVPAGTLAIDATIATDDLVLALGANATLDEVAAALVVRAASDDPADGWYGDIEIDGRVTRRPAWSPTRLLGEPTASSPMVVRARWLRSSGLGPDDPALPLRLAAEGAGVRHLPTVLTRHATPPPAPATESVEAHLKTIGIPASVADLGDRLGLIADPGFAPEVSIVIPSAGTEHPTRRGRRAVDELLAGLCPLPSRLQVIVVVGDEYHGDPTGLAGDNVELLRRPPGPFNFSAAVNQGILRADSGLVMMLNDDIDVDGIGFVDAMALHVQDPSVVAVGALLTYPDGTVQHAGMVIDDARPLHPFVGWQPADTAPHGGLTARDVAAVTGACLLVRREDFLATGGLSTELPLSFNDIDLCVRLRRAGGRVVVEPAARLVHHETLSREPVVSSDEWDRWIDRWGEIVDPWYHPGFHRPDDPHRLSRNADHLDPRPADAPFTPTPRDTALRSRVHRERPAAVVRRPIVSA